MTYIVSSGALNSTHSPHVFTWIMEVDTIHTAGYGYVRLYGSTVQNPCVQACPAAA